MITLCVIEWQIERFVRRTAQKNVEYWSFPLLIFGARRTEEKGEHIRHIQKWRWKSSKISLNVASLSQIANRKMAYGESNGHVTDDVTWHEKWRSWPQYA